MVDRCWKCAVALTDPFSAYCARCGVPLKRILPRTKERAPILAICRNSDCDWAITVDRTAALPSRCPKCRTSLLSHCWKCEARIADLNQHYCQACGVPLKRHKRSA
jgi:rRNA maturation endonuclease Nob1